VLSCSHLTHWTGQLLHIRILTWPVPKHAIADFCRVVSVVDAMQVPAVSCDVKYHGENKSKITLAQLIRAPHQIDHFHSFVFHISPNTPSLCQWYQMSRGKQTLSICSVMNVTSTAHYGFCARWVFPHVVIGIKCRICVFEWWRWLDSRQR
jgi:hypothetical protein